MPRTRGRFLLGNTTVSSGNMLKRKQREWIKEANKQMKVQKQMWFIQRQKCLNDILKNNIVLTENDYRLFHEVINDKTQFISGNSLFMAIHIKNIEKSIALNKNNLTNLNLDDITNIVIVFSCDNYNTELYYKFISEISKLFSNKNFIFIHDVTNKYYDFGKYKMAYEYFKKKGIQSNYIHVMNDSIIICEKIDKMCEEIKNRLKNNDYIGIVSSTEYRKHYQSWWFIVKKKIYDGFFRDIKLVDMSNGNLEINKWCLIQINEIANSNKYISQSEYKTDCLLDGPHCSNLFTPNKLFFQYWDTGFKILKCAQLKTWGDPNCKTPPGPCKLLISARQHFEYLID